MKASKSRVLFLLGILIFSFNLRIPITMIGPLIPMIQEELLLNSAMAGLITTIPLLVFCVLSPLAPKVGEKLGIVEVITLCLIAIFAGEILRSFFGAAGLFAGTIVIAIGIAFGNVLIPALIKYMFPDKIGVVTSLQIVGMALLSGIGIAISMPLAVTLGFGWRIALSCSILLATAGLYIWILIFKTPETKIDKNLKLTVKAKKGGSLYKNALAWQVTFAMGLQSILFYAWVAWMPTALQTYGMSASESAVLSALYQLCSLPASLVAAIYADRFKDQKLLSAICMAINIVGIVGLFFFKAHALLYVWVILMAIGSGSSVSLAFCFFGLRSHEPAGAAMLSGMAQAVGYGLAAIGPLSFGILYDLTGSFYMPELLLIAMTLLMTVFYMLASRDKKIPPQTTD